MSDTTTSPVRARSAAAQWADFRSFVARPRLPEGAMPAPGAGGAIARMFALDVILMAGLAAIAGVVMALGFELPETALAGMEITVGLALAVVIGAPIGEEIVFRGWLSGRPGHLAAIAVLVLVVLGLGMTGLAQAQADAGLASIAVLAVALAAVAGALYVWRRAPAMAWFARAFPLFFWLSTLGFACIHLLNFSEGALWVLLPLVLPQFVLGTILAYLRVHYGLWSSIVLHALHNGTALGLVWLGTRYAADLGAGAGAGG